MKMKIDPISKLEIDYQVAEYYIEPGYDQPEKTVLLADWNKVSGELAGELEEFGYTLDWEDEWLITDAGGAVRTSPDSYSWEPSFLITGGGEILTIEDDPQEWIEELQITDHLQPLGVLPSHIEEGDLLELGYKKDEEVYENGFHPGQTDNPEEIAKKLLTHAEYVVFRKEEQSQFYIKFEAWYK